MKTAIVCVIVPTNIDGPTGKPWRDLDSKIGGLLATHKKQGSELSTGVWQLDIDSTGLLILSAIVGGASNGGLTCKVMFLEENPQWIEVAPHSRA